MSYSLLASLTSYTNNNIMTDLQYEAPRNFPFLVKKIFDIYNVSSFFATIATINKDMEYSGLTEFKQNLYGYGSISAISSRLLQIIKTNHKDIEILREMQKHYASNSDNDSDNDSTMRTNAGIVEGLISLTEEEIVKCKKIIDAKKILDAKKLASVNKYPKKDGYYLVKQQQSYYYVAGKPPNVKRKDTEDCVIS